MSSPGVTNDGMVRDRFQAGRGAAANGIDPEVLQLAEGGGGTQTANAGSPSPAATPSSAGPSQPNLPFGLRVQQYLQGVGQRARDMVMAPDGQADHTIGSAIAAGFAGIPAEIGRQFIEGLKAAKRHALPENLQQLQESMDSPFPGAQPLLDLMGAAASPITGTTTSVLGRPVEAATGVKRDLVGNISAMLLPGGIIGKAGKVAEAGEEGEAAAAAGAAKPAAAAAKPAAEGAAPAAEPVEPPPAFNIEGQAPGSKLKVTPEIRAQATDFLAGKRADNPIQVSLENLSSNPDLNKTVADVARFIPKGAVKPDDIRDMNAYSLNLQPDEIMSQLVPAIPSDELQGAAGMIVNSAGTELQKLAKTAMEEPTPENQEAAVRAYAYANQVIGKFRDAGTDLGRGLRARQATRGMRNDFQVAVHDIITNVGPENVDEAIRKIAALPDPKQVSPFVSSLRWMGGRDGLLFGWYNWLLSNPATVVKKLTSDASVAGWNTAVRYAAEKFGSGEVRPGEAAALWHGYVGSMRDGLGAAAKALKEGHSQFYGDYQTMDGRVIRRTDNHPPEPIEEDAPTAGAIQYWRAALPTSWIGAADDFAKVVNYRAEARALAYRDGMIKGLSGEDLSNHIAQTMNNVPGHIHDQAVNAALRNTFQEPLSGLAASVQDVADRINIPVPGTGIEIPLGRVIMPFVKVPANIARFAYRNSPMAALLPSAAVKAELMAGGATRDMAIARMGMGTAVAAIVLPFVLGGRLTGRGPADPQVNAAWQRAGYKPYSVRVGNTWYGYNRVEPMGMTMAALADTVDTLRFARDEDADQLAWGASFGIGDAMLSKTYLQGVSDFIDALHDPDERAYAGNKLVSSMAMPQGAAALAQSVDTWRRQHYGLIDGIQARTPGFAQGLPPVRDQWGEPIPADKGFFPPLLLTGSVTANLLSPVDAAPAGNAQPIDKWIWENRDAFPQAEEGRLGLTRPGQVQTFDAGKVSVPLKLNPQQVDRLRALAGNELKDPQTKLGARDSLNALVNGNYPHGGTQAQWDRASPAARALMVLRVWNQYRDAAKKQVLKDNPDLQQALREKATSRVQALQAPNLGGN